MLRWQKELSFSTGKRVAGRRSYSYPDGRSPRQCLSASSSSCQVPTVSSRSTHGDRVTLPKSRWGTPITLTVMTSACSSRSSVSSDRYSWGGQPDASRHTQWSALTAPATSADSSASTCPSSPFRARPTTGSKAASRRRPRCRRSCWGRWKVSVRSSRCMRKR